MVSSIQNRPHSECGQDNNTTLKIKHLAVDQLIPNPNNARTHSKKQIRQIADSIKQFGFTNPVLINQNGDIIAGHGRLKAAFHLGHKKVPAICLENLSEEEIRAYIITDNRLAELAGWDRELLGLELQGLSELDLTFDLSIIGFETPEIDILINELDFDTEQDPDDETPELKDGPSITQPGDIWCIGNHRLICGDATKADTYIQLLNGSKAQMIFTDPPYYVPIKGHVSGLGAVKHREFSMAAGEMSEDQFSEFLATVFRYLVDSSNNGSIHFICMDWRHLREMIAASHDIYSEFKNLCVWAKSNGGMGSLYHSQHELIFMFKAGKEPHINNVELGKYGRNQTNIWNYPGISSFGKNRDCELALHPTVKPVKMVSDAILDCSKRGGIILDAFAGSGTTLVAAENVGRRGYGIEIDPHYCDVIIGRVAAVAKKDAVHAVTGKSFAEIAPQNKEI